ncbi:hypothetical protein [Litorihabitans aurantiacus]|uniref:Secreted protein n=1 Tax=Litorihabitans aurantiacus TaxID=1930061 RepID=A0AA37XFJ9_9MICO|nr:hypothetical protein [Litorihabitans aurantiacus]GMA32151.1 hypothetical protein GCM10025875_21430 [Litorihabitans aurantiacus]
MRTIYRTAAAAALALGFLGTTAATAPPAEAAQYTARFTTYQGCMDGMYRWLSARNINVGYSCAPVRIPGTNQFWYLGASNPYKTI